MLEDLKTKGWDFNYNFDICELTSLTTVSVNFSTVVNKKYEHLLCARQGWGLCLGQHTGHFTRYIKILNADVNINIKKSFLFITHKNPRKLVKVIPEMDVTN